MQVIEFIKNYWVQITFVCTFLIGTYRFLSAIVEAIRCLLKYAILSIFDKCKEKKEITTWQYETLVAMFRIYTILGGNSFVADLVQIVKTFKIVD